MMRRLTYLILGACAVIAVLASSDVEAYRDRLRLPAVDCSKGDFHWTRSRHWNDECESAWCASCQREVCTSEGRHFGDFDNPTTQREANE